MSAVIDSCELSISLKKVIVLSKESPSFGYIIASSRDKKPSQQKPNQNNNPKQKRNVSYQHVISISNFTWDIKFLAEAGFALVLDCDPTFIITRVCCPGGAEFIYHWVVCGGRRVDGNVVLCELESMRQVRNVVMTDADLTVNDHRYPTRNGAAGEDGEANGIYNVGCRSTDTQA